MPDTNLDTSNHFLVGATTDTVSILRHVPPAISLDLALNLAAWLVAVADRKGEFDVLLKAVRNT